MDAKLTKIYYSPQGYWKGVSAIKKFTNMRWLLSTSPAVTKKRSHWPQKTLTRLPRLSSRFTGSPLTWPQMLQVDPGREFMGGVTKEMEKHKTYIRRGRTEIHRDQAIVERFNCTLAERLFGHQYVVEMLLPEGKRWTEWVKRLPDVVSALNNEVTSLIGKKPAVAIKEKAVSSKPSTKYNRPVGLAEKKLPPLINVRYLYQPRELEGGTKRATDPIWSLKVYQVVENKTKPNEPVVYYLSDGPKRDFVREELLVVPPNTQLPPTWNVRVPAFVCRHLLSSASYQMVI